MKRHGKAILAAALILAALAAAFYFGGSAPGMRGWKIKSEEPETPLSQPEPGLAPEPSPAPLPGAVPTPDPDPAPDPTPDPAADPDPTADPVLPVESDPVPAPDPAPSGNSAPEPVPVSPPEPLPAPDPQPEVRKCTISISCAALLEHLDMLGEDKAELVPADGWILAPVEAELEEGDSVFDVLKRVTREHKIHLEFAETPLYGSVYIEGIGNLYEFDCGEQSGWMYAVNDWFPNYGCSKYPVEDGDVIRWVYTCDLGADVGGAWNG